jgi:hypothetical protein
MLERLMAFKDILLTLTSYLDPTPASVAENAVSIAAALVPTLRLSMLKTSRPWPRQTRRKRPMRSSRQW